VLEVQKCQFSISLASKIYWDCYYRVLRPSWPLNPRWPLPTILKNIKCNISVIRWARKTNEVSFSINYGMTVVWRKSKEAHNTIIITVTPFILNLLHFFHNILLVYTLYSSIQFFNSDLSLSILACQQFSLLHLMNTRSDSSRSLMRARCGLMKSPPRLKTRSTGADVAVDWFSIHEIEIKIKKIMLKNEIKIKILTVENEIKIIKFEIEFKIKTLVKTARTRTRLWQSVSRDSRDQGRYISRDLQHCEW